MRSCMLALLLLAPTAPASVGALTSWQVPDELAAILRSARTDLEACPSGPLELGETLRVTVHLDISRGSVAPTVTGAPEALRACILRTMSALVSSAGPQVRASATLLWTGVDPEALAEQRLLREQLREHRVPALIDLQRHRAPIERRFDGPGGSASFGELGVLGDLARHRTERAISRLLPDLHAAWQASDARTRGGRFVVRLRLDSSRPVLDVTDDELDEPALRQELSRVLGTLRLPVPRDAPPLLTVPLLFTP